MLKNTKLRVGVVAASAVAALTLGVTSPVYADPTAGTFPILVGVGSDTTQDVVNGLASVIPNIGSYDAVGSATITTRSGGTPFTRPNGSGAGQVALSQAINGGTVGGVAVSGYVDFARSSSGPDATNPGTALTFIPFGVDAVSYAVLASSDFPRDIPLGSAADDSVTPAPFTLRNIYRSVSTSYTDNDFNTVTIRPLIPQSGSGTRKFWVGTALGLVDGGSSNTLGNTVTSINNTVEEHNGTFVTGAGDIVPFSVAQYIAQGNHAALPTTVVERRGNIQLGNIGTKKPYLVSSNGGAVLNTGFPVTRLVYNVVQTSRLSGTSAADVALQNTFVGSTSLVCSQSALIQKYGFATTSQCGTTTRTQALKLS